jgi:hypothetical protein
MADKLHSMRGHTECDPRGSESRSLSVQQSGTCPITCRARRAALPFRRFAHSPRRRRSLTRTNLTVSAREAEHDALPHHVSSERGRDNMHSITRAHVRGCDEAGPQLRPATLPYPRRLQQFDRVRPKFHRNRLKLRHLEPPLPALVLRHERLWPTEPRGQVGLGDASDASRSQQCGEASQRSGKWAPNSCRRERTGSFKKPERGVNPVGSPRSDREGAVKVPSGALRTIGAA